MRRLASSLLTWNVGAGILQGRPPTIPGGATLVFEVELLGVSR